MSVKHVTTRRLLSFCLLLTFVFAWDQSETRETDLEGTLRFAGEPMSTLTGVEPDWWILDRPSGVVLEDYVASYNTSTGEYTLSNLSGQDLIIAIEFHVTGLEPTLPGNYFVYHYIELDSLSEPEKMAYDIGLQMVIHMTEPWDNENIIFSISDTHPIHPSPLTFAWEPVPYATRYRVTIDRYRDIDHPQGYGPIDVVLSDAYYPSPFEIEMEESNEKEHYELMLWAMKDEEYIGAYMTTYTNGYGGDFRFKIGDELCFLNVWSPSAGYSLWAGLDFEIAWIYAGAGDSVVIEYSTNSGENWKNIAESTENDGVYNWTIPGTPSESCLLRICNMERTCCDECNGLFSMRAECDFAVAHIAAPNPVSVDYPTPVQVAITNLGSFDMALGDAYIDILDEGGESIFFGEAQPMGRLYEDPFFLLPAGETLYAYEYDWMPAEAGTYYLKVMLDVPCDISSVNDTLLIGPVTVSEAGTGFLGYFDPYSTERDTVELEPNAGPAVRFTIPDDMSETIPHTILIGGASVDSSSSFWVYLYGPGENDSTFGIELIPPFEFFPGSVDEEGRMVIDLMDTSLVSPEDYENLISLLLMITNFLSGDFWVHVRATDQTQLGFIALPLLPDAAFHRNWIFYAEGEPRGHPGIKGHRCGEGELIRYKKGWEEIIGLTFSPSWTEGERGDVNYDNSVNVLDVLSVVNHILGVVELTDLGELRRADCNADEQINILDALGIVNVILGIGECEP